MIQAKEIIKLVKTQLSNWNISRDESALYQYLNMGLSDLGEKFNLWLKIETIDLESAQCVYNLKADDVNLVLKIYDENGKELADSDVINSKEWDYKLVNYKTFVLNNAKKIKGLLYVLYKAAHIEVSDEKDTLDIPSIFKEVLMLYMMYLGTSTIRSDSSKDGNQWDSRTHFLELYTRKCQELVLNGYKLAIGAESGPIQIKGYV